MFIDRKYLPSKNFIIKTSIIIAILMVVFGVYMLVKYIQNYKNNKESTVLVKDLIQKDTNNNGIADWEESLWGFDPTKDGEANKEAILARKKELAIENKDLNNEKVTESGLLVREFMTIALALEHEGKLNDTSLASLSSLIGQKLDSKPIENKYTKTGQTIVENTEANKKNYFSKMKSLLEKYKNVGTELMYISEGVKNGDKTALELAKNIGEDYIIFADEFIKIPVPEDLSQVSLNINNLYYKIGLSIENTSMFLEDSLVGIRGFMDYKKYIDELYTEIDNLSKII